MDLHFMKDRALLYFYIVVRVGRAELYINYRKPRFPSAYFPFPVGVFYFFVCFLLYRQGKTIFH